MQQAVVARELTWSVDGVEILPPTSFAVASGSCTAVVGPNGSGKTTLLKMVSGRLEPSAGSIAVFGRTTDDRDDAFRQGVSDLVGAPATYDDLTVGDHLDFLGRLWGVPSPHDVLARLGADHLSPRYPDELSSGQRQLFSLALALARPARLVVLDEPEQRLDADYRALLDDVLASRRDAGTAILIATHDAALRDHLADRVISLGDDE